MIELPESNTLAKQLNETVVNKTIVKAQAAHSPHGFAFYNGEPAEYSDTLESNSITKAAAYGGIVELAIEGGYWLEFNDGVNLRYLQKGSKSPAKHQLYLELDDGNCLFATIQMYGGIMLYSGSIHTDNMYHRAAREKPSPLTDLFNQEYFGSIVQTAPKNLSVKGLLATEQRIPGLGNGSLHDILWDAEINPKTKVSSMSDKFLSRLFDSIKNVLKDMTDKGGKSTEKDIYGNPGGYDVILSSKTVNYPCVRCGGTIVRKAYMGGNVYYCENCQPI